MASIVRKNATMNALPYTVGSQDVGRREQLRLEPLGAKLVERPLVIFSPL
jgi:hypothetical protein